MMKPESMSHDSAVALKPPSAEATHTRVGPLSVRSGLLYLILALLAVAIYLLLAQLQNGEFGFPLDDAWIHQVYARNLGLRGEFAFFPGQPSTGSTSPLWAILLSAGYALCVDFRVWTVGLGVLFLALSALLARRLAYHLDARPFIADWLVPLFIIFEWHLTWAAASGMEIPLFIFFSLALVELFLAAGHPFGLGLVAGLLALTRPEGVVLGALVALGLGIREWQKRTRLVERAAEWFAFALAFALLLVPYLAFNLVTSGTLLPNTFYAKSEEYKSLLTGTNFFLRWLSLYRQPLIGGQILLVPGIIWIGWKWVQARRVDWLIPLTWILALPALYAARLPVDYQFGRYEMPVIPFIGLYGIVGTGGLLGRIPKRAIRRAWALAIGVLVVAFAGLGANQYAQAAATINCEMVATARWTAANVPLGALIAVHDIGAQGYFDSHPMLDLAGLVSPEVIPFIRDETRLREWMHARGASYAIFFPSWYPGLAQDANFVLVHTENCAVTHEAGEVDLAVYKIR